MPRLAACIANEGCFALGDQVASEEDINTAMRLGFNWPLGPIEWGERLGWARAQGVLEELRERSRRRLSPGRRPSAASQQPLRISTMPTIVSGSIASSSRVAP